MASLPLSRFMAASEAARAARKDATSSKEETFPMYTVSLEVLLQMSRVITHEELMRSGTLTEFEEPMGRAAFVSHQWLANAHPDPDGEQLKVLQEALHNLLAGTTQVREPIGSTVYNQRWKIPTSADFQAEPLYIWYDFFSCPQGMDSISQTSRQHAINSIVSYVTRCAYFFALCPALMHRDKQRLLGQDTWAERGWCRMERLAKELATREDGFMIVIESSWHQHLVLTQQKHLDAPGAGHFTQEFDRTRISRVIVQMVWKKLLYFIERGDLHGYRFLLNKQATCCLKGLAALPLEGLVPGFLPCADPFAEPEAFIVERFLHENGFNRISERDASGWTPFCYAILTDRENLVTALLNQRADIGDRITKPTPRLLLPKNMPVLSLAAYIRSNGSLKVLLAARAKLHGRSNNGVTALHMACASNNVQGAQILLAAGADPGMLCFPGVDAFTSACCSGGSEIVADMLNKMPGLDLRHRLHMSLQVEGCPTDVIATLIDAKADVNERFFPKQAIFRLLHLLGPKHRLSPTPLTLRAYHYKGATPLMMGLINCQMGSVRLLLEAQAAVDIPNVRGKTAADVAEEVGSSELLISLLKGRRSTQEKEADDTFSI